MSILDMWGFEWGSQGVFANHEGITFLTSIFDYENNYFGVVPRDSSSFFIRTESNSQARGNVIPQTLPSGSQFWLHFLWFMDTFDTVSDLQYVEWKQGTTRIGNVRLQENTGVAEVVIGGIPIVAANSAGNPDTFTIAGDYTTKILVGSRIIITGNSFGNNGEYTVTGTTFSSPNTIITVAQSISSNNPQGELAYSVTATSPRAILGVNRWRRVHVHVNLQSTATGWIRVYYDGDLSTPVLDVSTEATNPGSLTFDTLGFSLPAQGNFLDDLVIMDPLDATGITDPEEIAYVTISGKAPNADGNYTAWTATPGAGADYEDIDDSPPVDSSFIQATATNQASTFGFESANSDNTILAVKWKGRFLRSGSSAGVNMNIRQRDVSAGTDFDTADIPVPGDGYIFRTFDQKPGGGGWTVADFDDTEFGVVSKT